MQQYHSTRLRLLLVLMPLVSPSVRMYEYVYVIVVLSSFLLSSRSPVHISIQQSAEIARKTVCLNRTVHSVTITHIHLWVLYIVFKFKSLVETIQFCFFTELITRIIHTYCDERLFFLRTIRHLRSVALNKRWNFHWNK